jgi:hypothetical protein
MGKKKPTIKLNGHTLMQVPKTISIMVKYSPGGTARIALSSLITGMSMNGKSVRIIREVKNIFQMFLNRLVSLPEMPAPTVMPRNQLENIIPMHNSLPKNRTRSSLIKNIWALIAYAPTRTISTENKKYAIQKMPLNAGHEIFQQVSKNFTILKMAQGVNFHWI